MITDSIRFLPDPPSEVMAHEYIEASERLFAIQTTLGHKGCPNTNAKPAPCSFCLKHYGDKYTVWKLLMVVNAPTA